MLYQPTFKIHKWHSTYHSRIFAPIFTSTLVPCTTRGCETSIIRSSLLVFCFLLFCTHNFIVILVHSFFVFRLFVFDRYIFRPFFCELSPYACVLHRNQAVCIAIIASSLLTRHFVKYAIAELAFIIRFQSIVIFTEMHSMRAFASAIKRCFKRSAEF